MPALRRIRLPLPTSSLIVPVLAGLGGVAFLAWKPGVARSMAHSSRAAGFTLAVAALVLGAGWLLTRLGRGAGTTVAVQLVPVLVAFSVTVAPAFRQVTVDEALPTDIGTASRPADTESPNSPLPGSEPGRAGIVARGMLRGIDHRASGHALLLRRQDGPQVLRLERLDVEPGPDYQVYLVPGVEQTRPGNGLHLGRLRGNRGNQNYDVPLLAEVRIPATVLIWCRAFAVPVVVSTIR